MSAGNFRRSGCQKATTDNESYRANRGARAGVLRASSRRSEAEGSGGGWGGVQVGV